MRFPIVIFSLIASLNVSAQHLTDTTFWDGGQIQQVHYFSLVKSSDLSRADMFTRGIRIGDPITEVRMVDSTRFHDASGAYLKTNVAGTRKRFDNSLKSQSRKKSIRVKEEDMLRSVPKVVYLEARAGMVVRKKVWSPSGRKPGEFKRKDKNLGIETLETPADANGSFTVKVRIPAGAIRSEIILDIGEETDWTQPLSLRGYHLNESDFKRRDQLTDEQTWRAEGQDFLYLRLRSTEKLMHVYRDGEQYTVLPVGRQLDEIRVGGLTAGKYLLEIIDLGTREKRYYWVIKG